MSLITISILIIVAMVFTFGAKQENHLGIFNIEQSTIWKGLCSIVVIFVHIPPLHQNNIQMAVHSFGYIAVTIFFMLSGYGLRWSIEHKPNYLDGFFSNRIPSLMIPFIITNALWVLLRSFSGESYTVFQIIIRLFYPGISFVHVLLLFYIAFFAIYSVRSITIHNKDILLSLFVVSYSAIGGFEVADFRWNTESLGFAYGVILCSISNRTVQFFTDKSLFKIILTCLSSLLLGIAYLKYKYIEILGGYILRLTLGVSIISFAILLSYRFRFGNRVAKFLGEISYEIFLLHALVMTLIDRLIADTYLPHISSGIFIAVTIIGTLIISFIVQIIDSHIIQWIKRIFNSKPRPQLHLS